MLRSTNRLAAIKPPFISGPGIKKLPWRFPGPLRWIY
jgi:hypothetical protein